MFHDTLEKSIRKEKPKENIRGWIENNLTEPNRNRIVENRSKRKRENEETEKGSGRKVEKISKEVQKCAEKILNSGGRGQVLPPCQYLN